MVRKVARKGEAELDRNGDQQRVSTTEANSKSNSEQRDFKFKVYASVITMFKHRKLTNDILFIYNELYIEFLKQKI